MEVYRYSGVFRPKHGIADKASGSTKEMVAEMRANFHPFLMGSGSHAGKPIALAEIPLVVARTLLRFVFIKTPRSSVGESRPELGWGERARKRVSIVDAYVSLKRGSEVQSRKRQYDEVKFCSTWVCIKMVKTAELGLGISLWFTDTDNWCGRRVATVLWGLIYIVTEGTSPFPCALLLLQPSYSFSR